MNEHGNTQTSYIPFSATTKKVKLPDLELLAEPHVEPYHMADENKCQECTDLEWKVASLTAEIKNLQDTVKDLRHEYRVEHQHTERLILKRRLRDARELQRNTSKLRDDTTENLLSSLPLVPAGLLTIVMNKIRD